MQILAIDPGIANTGFAYIDGLTSQRNCGTIITQPGMDIDRRIKDICEALPDIPIWDVVLIEDTFGKFVKKTNFLIGGLLQHLESIEFIFVAPGKWIRDMFGSNMKGQYKALAMGFAESTGWNPQTQHEADAVSMLEWYARRQEQSNL